MSFAVTAYVSQSNLDGSYASIDDLHEISLPENTGHDFSTRQKVRNLKIASSRANTVLGQRFQVPLKYWSETVVWAVCELATCQLMGVRGHDPEAKTEKLFAAREAKAMGWLEAAADYEVTPDPRLQAAEPDLVGVIHSDRPRGWNSCSGSSSGSPTTQNQYGRGGFFTDR